MSYIGDAIADAKKQVRNEIVKDLIDSLQHLKDRKPVDPHYMIGGQTHPTVTKDFVADFLVALVDKYEEKPYGYFYDENANFISWYTRQKETELQESGVTFFYGRHSARTATEQGFLLPATAELRA